jgi:hypothetical protein
MALKHMLKHTETEAVLKCYIVDSAGGSIDISLQNDLTRSTQVYVTPDSFPNEGSDGLTIHDYTGSRVYISGIWWGLKKDKQLDITRIIVAGVGGYVHSHYYLTNSGVYDYTSSGGGFYDRCYAQKDIRLTFDGPGHCIIRLRKEGWVPKVETAEFGSYDDVTQVGS